MVLTLRLLPLAAAFLGGIWEVADGQNTGFCNVGLRQIGFERLKRE